MFKKLRQEKRQRRALAEAIDRRVEALTQRFEADALHRRESGVQRNAPRELVVSLTSEARYEWVHSVPGPTHGERTSLSWRWFRRPRGDSARGQKQLVSETPTTKKSKPFHPSAR